MDYNRAIQINPNNALAYLNRGSAYHNLWNEQAITDYETALRLGLNEENTEFAKKMIDVTRKKLLAKEGIEEKTKSLLDSLDTLTGKDVHGITWTYTGDVFNGLPHGKGKVKYSDGKAYDGDFVNGNRHGKGKGTSEEGAVFEGDWVDGMMIKGKATMPEGDVYEGDFVNMVPHGKGKFTGANGRVYHEGNFINGEPA